MPKIARLSDLPRAVRQHLADQMHDRSIGISDVNQLRLWIETGPTTPQGDWYKDFGSFELSGEGHYPKTFLLPGQAAKRKSAVASFPMLWARV